MLAGASGVGFILAICGSNAMTPLLPGYVETHDFGPAAASVLFATYFIALIIVLLISARGPLVRHTHGAADRLPRGDRRRPPAARTWSAHWRGRSVRSRGERTDRRDPRDRSE
ncbi:hypothetical protein [Gordonia lacunae]|uniref:hypothetical protein n=1 Tax=Gordonia lacunae TaxID=417102 RepID=UPI001FC9690A|nr:hypothetical protein [Gordonia lacunae]